MPRRSGGGGGGRAPARAPARPTVPQQRPVAPQQQRSASTATAQPPAKAGQPQAQQSQGPGLFGQMASTAAGVAVGSSIGHAVGGWFGGGSSSEQPAQAQDNTSAAAYGQDGAYASSAYAAPKACEGQIGQFKTCMDQNEGNLTICGWYLDQLKACQSAASQY